MTVTAAEVRTSVFQLFLTACARLHFLSHRVCAVWRQRNRFLISSVGTTPWAAVPPPRDSLGGPMHGRCGKTTDGSR